MQVIHVYQLPVHSSMDSFFVLAAICHLDTSLQAFMRAIFPQDSLQDSFKYFEVFVECSSLLEPRQGSTFHVDFQAFYSAATRRQTRRE